jgi:hypothetical protein
VLPQWSPLVWSLETFDDAFNSLRMVELGSAGLLCLILLSIEVSLTRSLQVRGFVVHFSNILNQARLHPHLWDKEFFIDVDTFL